MAVHQAQEMVAAPRWRRVTQPAKPAPGSFAGLALALLASFAAVDVVLVGAPYVTALEDSGSWLIVATQALTGVTGLVLVVTGRWRQLGVGLIGGSALACLVFGLLLRIGLPLSS